MRIDVAFAPAGLAAQEVAGRTVFVVDILRATTTICAALHHGAKAVVPCASNEDALRLKETLGPDEVVLAGEFNTHPIPGFQLGNSPREFTDEKLLRGRFVALTTTNGTRALLAVAHAAQVFPFAAANFSLVAQRARDVVENDGDLLVLCSGREGAFALEDAYAAGRLVHAAIGGRKLRQGLNDAALASLDLVRRYRDRWNRPLHLSTAGRELTRLGYGGDVADAATQDAYPVLAHFHERRVTVIPAA